MPTRAQIISDYRALRDGTLAALICEIQNARLLGELPPELAERAELAEEEQRRRRRSHLGPTEFVNELLNDILSKAPANSTIDDLADIWRSAVHSLRFCLPPGVLPSEYRPIELLRGELDDDELEELMECDA
mgnify:CR=1 FL=1